MPLARGLDRYSSVQLRNSPDDVGSSSRLQGLSNDWKKVTSEKQNVESDQPVGLEEEDEAMSPGV